MELILEIARGLLPVLAGLVAVVLIIALMDRHHRKTTGSGRGKRRR